MRAEEIGGDNRLMGGGDAYLSCLGDRSTQEQASTQKLRQILLLSRGCLWIQLILFTILHSLFKLGFIFPPRIFCEDPKLFPNTSLQLPNPIIWLNLWNQ